MQAQPAAKRPQFIYVLRVPPRLHDRGAWTDKGNAVVSAHFAREADNEEAARAFMNGDPAVEAA